MEIDFVEYLYDKKYELAVIECTMGFRGRYGIVDVLSYKGDSISNGRGKRRTRDVSWRCYELKSSLGDFNSKHKLTFVGNYNYFVVPELLYEEIKDKVEDGIGIYVYNHVKRTFRVAKRAKARKLVMDESEVMHDYLVSANRDARRWNKSLARRKGLV